MTAVNTIQPLNLVSAKCCVCDSDDATQIGTGEDFEYHTSPDKFAVSQCNYCGLVYLNPRPAVSEFERIYPSNYHAFDFSEEDFGIIYKVRSRLEAKRILSWCGRLPDNARIIDIGCGDGFHLRLLKEYGNKNWKLEGLDIDQRAAKMAEKTGINVHLGSIGEIDLPTDHYDLAIMVQTIEHVARPDEALRSVRDILKPGGTLIIVTDNTGSLDFSIFMDSHWGGYHFPRHWNLFNRVSLTKLAEKTGFEVARMTTQVSPVNWVYSIHNRLVDRGWPDWLINQFTLKSTISLSVFTAIDVAMRIIGRGGLLNAALKKPDESNEN